MADENNSQKSDSERLDKVENDIHGLTLMWYTAVTAVGSVGLIYFAKDSNLWGPISKFFSLTLGGSA